MGIWEDLHQIEPYEHDTMCASMFDANRFKPQEETCNCSVRAWKNVKIEIEGCARLQQALRAYDAAFSEWERGGGIWLGAPALRLWRSMAREALAGPGSEQSSLTESGSAVLPDTPADNSPLTAEGDDSMWRDDPPGIVRYSRVVDRYSYEWFIGRKER